MVHEWSFSDQGSLRSLWTLSLEESQYNFIYFLSVKVIYIVAAISQSIPIKWLSVCVRALLQAQERHFGRLWIKSVILVNISCIYSNYYVTPAPINNLLCDNIKSWEKNVGEVRLSLMKPDVRCFSQSAIERLWQKDGNLENKSSRDLQWWQNCFENTNGKVSKGNNTVLWIFRNYSEYY